MFDAPVIEHGESDSTMKNGAKVSNQRRAVCEKFKGDCGVCAVFSLDNVPHNQPTTTENQCCDDRSGIPRILLTTPDQANHEYSVVEKW